VVAILAAPYRVSEVRARMEVPGADRGRTLAPLLERVATRRREL